MNETYIKVKGNGCTCIGPEGNPYNDMVTYFINPFGQSFFLILKYDRIGCPFLRLTWLLSVAAETNGQNDTSYGMASE